MNRRPPTRVLARDAVIALLVLGPIVVVQACAPGTKAWTPSDTRKATEIVRGEEALMSLCKVDDAGPVCRPSHVRALAGKDCDKAASMLYAHGEAIPDDAGGCR